MTMSSNSLKLPSTLDAKSNKILMFDCLLLLGDELGNYYDEKMRELQGSDWLRTLAQQRNDYNLTLNDPDFVIKEPLRSDSPLRAILPKSPSFYKNLDILRKIRNYIAHNKTEGGYEQTREILGILLSVSLDINLTHCVLLVLWALWSTTAMPKGTCKRFSNYVKKTIRENKVATVIGVLIGGVATRFLEDGNLLVTTALTGMTTVGTLLIWLIVKKF